MTLDSRSLEQLQALGRQLPQKLPKPSDYQNKDLPKTNKRHPIETEKNPKILFQELINASPDGNVPSHLLTRLKELETKQLDEINNHLINQPDNSTPKRNKPLSKKQRDREAEEEILYASFDRFLLEDED